MRLQKIIKYFLLTLLLLFSSNVVLAEEKKVYLDNEIGRDILCTLKKYLTEKNLDLYGVDTIIFNDISSTEIHILSDKYLDISANKDGTVMAYVVDNKLYIQYDGTLYLTKANRLFDDFSNIKRIEGLNYVNTSNLGSMSGMFANMKLLETVDVSGFDTSNVVTMQSMFDGDENLKALDVSKWDTSKVENMYKIFNNCLSLSTADVSGWDTSNVTNMGFMFRGAKSLTELDVSKWNTDKVTDMSYMFTGIDSIAELDISNFNTSNVTNMREMFAYSDSITELDLTNFNTRKVTDMYAMFSSMSNLEILDLSSFETLNVKNLKYMFYDDRKLKTIYISKGWDMSNWTVNDYNNYEMIFAHSGYTNSLVGGNGTRNTKGNSGRVTDIFPYIRIDGVDNPGLFSYKYNVTSSEYDLGNEYIYIGKNKFQTNKINIDNSEVTIVENNDNNTINFYYNGINLKQYFLVGISSEDYNIMDDYIFVKNDSFDISKIKTTNSDVEVNYNKLYVKYNNQILAHYDLINKIEFDIKSNLIYKLKPQMTIKALIINLENTLNTSLLFNDNSMNDSAILKTGMIVKLKKGSENLNYNISVSGDVNGDGEITPLDYVKIKNNIMGTNMITGDEYIQSADYNDDGEITPLDYVKVKNYIMNGGV